MRTTTKRLAALVLPLALVAGACGDDDGGDEGAAGSGGGGCDFGEIFTTDGRIPELELEVVDDPGVFILYNVSLTVPQDIYDQAPEEFEELTEKLLAPLDNETMADLNRQVSAEGEDAADVADAYLEDQGLTEDLSQLDLSSLDVTVGSKDFVEQFVLGEILIAALEAGGASVTNQVNLGGTSVNRAALESGEIDMYWEYNGTGWTVHLAQEDPSDDPDTLTEAVRELDAQENSIVWVGQSPFNNTYGFATSKEFAESDGPFDLQGMADYLEANESATVCLETEFPNRPDGLVLFEEATGYEVPDSQIEILDTNVIYQETANNT